MSEDLGCMGSIVCHCHSYSAIRGDKEEMVKEGSEGSIGIEGS